MKLKRPKESEMCAPGYHIVRGHDRTNSQGTTCWVNWREQGLKFPAADPLLIKAMVAFESGFNPLARSTVKGSSAFGLMQVTDQARRILSGSPDSKGYIEGKSPFARVSKSDIIDPVINVATGTRWLFYKNTSIPSRAEKNLFNTIKNYH